MVLPVHPIVRTLQHRLAYSGVIAVLKAPEQLRPRFLRIAPLISPVVSIGAEVGGWTSTAVDETPFAYQCCAGV